MLFPPAESLLWLLPYATIPYLARRKPALVECPPLTTGPLVSVIVPARNEADNIGPLLESLCRTSYGPVEILVVDDRSSDDTATRAGAVAAADPRVRVLSGQDPPPGWYGKPWACYQGWGQARGEILAFTDADTRHQPEVLAHAVGALQQSDADLLTIVTGQDCVSFWERLIMPQFWLPLGLRYHPERVNAARRARDVIANGQFIMVRRDAYLRAGTHEAVRHEVAEDLALAQAFLGTGLRVRMWWADDLVRTRMYTGFAALVEGWSKNVYLGSRATFPDQPVLGAIAPLLPLAAMLWWLVAPAAALLTGGEAWTLWAWGLATGFWMLISFGMRIPPWYGLLHPLGALAAAGIVLRSIRRGGRQVEWRGRTYRDRSAP